jgi:glutathione peroxidase
MTIYDVDIDALAGGSAELDRYRGRAVLVVNVASRCGRTPQYAGLQAAGSAEDTPEYCSTAYGVTFPLTEKVHVGEVAGRFGPTTRPQDGEPVAVIEKLPPR